MSVLTTIAGAERCEYKARAERSAESVRPYVEGRSNKRNAVVAPLRARGQAACLAAAAAPNIPHPSKMKWMPTSVPMTQALESGQPL